MPVVDDMYWIAARAFVATNAADWLEYLADETLDAVRLRIG